MFKDLNQLKPEELDQIIDKWTSCRFILLIRLLVTKLDETFQRAAVKKHCLWIKSGFASFYHFDPTKIDDYNPNLVIIVMRLNSILQ